MAPVVLVRSDHRQGAAAARALGKLAARFLEALGQATAEVSIVVTTDRRIRRINREWRDKDQPTDVLSFPAAPLPSQLLSQRGQPLGDVVISLDTARRRAKQEGQPLAEELARYLAHGLLHLLGHDHQEPAETRRMARAEAKLLGGAGMLGTARRE
ncbi:MAG: rRNA maturation RNase YbeY [Deltaproteobacteria bacterium]|nr:rRNA maturation RNase YbeY [Deltaproteobacteria bacterium]